MPGALDIKRLVVSPIETNCYIVSRKGGTEAFIIDPGDDAAVIAEAVCADGLRPAGIINTHGHADHAGANGELKDRFNCPILIHELDAPYLLDPELNLSMFMGGRMDGPAADRILKDGEEACLGDTAFRVIHSPGHTPGGICLFAEGVLFSGDTLFSSSVGRTDFPGGSQEALLTSIRTKLLTLPEETVVYPGHGPSTIIGVEKDSNPWL
jgi:glyoxylase-like metal-dependent hydrolase (beta-lactamase superfamily II)